MPPVPSAWSSWNFAREEVPEPSRPVSISYHTNRLQGLHSREQYFVTLNRTARISFERALDENAYSTRTRYITFSLRHMV